MTVAEAKPESVSNSKLLLEKISTKLSKEQYTQFKVGLHNFHAAKKSANMEQKIKYYKILRSLFSDDLVLFGEIEKFINFTGNVKEQPPAATGEKVGLKRKFEPETH
jgi:hypothetical protein